MLTGSLTDLAIPEVVRIPVSSNKTGELLIATMELDARLYYVEGKLVHLSLDTLEGPDVLDEIVRWHEGEFEFRPNVLTESVTFDGDLEAALSRSIARANGNGPGADPVAPDERARRLLYHFLADNDFAIHACILHPDDTMDVCGADRTDAPRWLAALRANVVGLVANHPRKGLQRILLEDDEGTLVVTCFDDGAALLVAAKADTKLGVVSHAVDRLTRKLAEIRHA